MLLRSYHIAKQKIDCYFDAQAEKINEVIPNKKFVVITDDNIALKHQFKLQFFEKIIIPNGEKNKNQETVDFIIQELINKEISKGDYIIGIGGGVITDLAGFVASIFKRGVKLGLVPTTVLAMVDAAIGGKNGINSGEIKNVIGTIYQPSFILYDFQFLETLPLHEWSNGFAEIIKHASIEDEDLFCKLETSNLQNFIYEKELLADLIKRNVSIKFKIVETDEFDENARKVLNFGHTLGHAIENLYNISHGNAVAIGMVFACNLSKEFYHLDAEITKRMNDLLLKYSLPVSLKANAEKVIKLFLQDKKRSDDSIDFILIHQLGKGKVERISISSIETSIKKFFDDSNY
jgi:3-dehydroquinate synthase